METVKVLVISPTGSGKYKGTLFLESGIISYEENGETEFSSVTAEVMSGFTVMKALEPEALKTEEPESNKQETEKSLEEIKEPETTTDKSEKPEEKPLAKRSSSVKKKIK